MTLPKWLTDNVSLIGAAVSIFAAIATAGSASYSAKTAYKEQIALEVIKSGDDTKRIREKFGILCAIGMVEPTDKKVTTSETIDQTICQNSPAAATTTK